MWIWQGIFRNLQTAESEKDAELEALLYELGVTLGVTHLKLLELI